MRRCSWLPTVAVGALALLQFINVSYNRFNGPLPVVTVESQNATGATFDLSHNCFNTSSLNDLLVVCKSLGDVCEVTPQNANSDCSM